MTAHRYIAPHRLAQSTRDWEAIELCEAESEQREARHVTIRPTLVAYLKSPLPYLWLSGLVSLYFLTQFARVAF